MTYDPAVTWLSQQRNRAELEAQKERVRQAFSRMTNVSTPEWVQGIVYVEGCSTVEQLKAVCKSYNIVWKAEGDMVTKAVELANLKAEMAKLQAKIDKVEYGRFGKEPANGSVFKIERRFEQFGKGYTYAAVRADGNWYLTGTVGAGLKVFSWEELKTWVGKYSRVWVMTAREELVD
jgi:hypothetical protein